MSSRWLNDSNLSPFFICRASLLWPGRTKPQRRRVSDSGDTGDQEQPRGHPVCAPAASQTTFIKPWEGGLKHPSPLARDCGTAAKHPKVQGTTGLGAAHPPWWEPDPPPWLCQGAACAAVLPPSQMQKPKEHEVFLLSCYSKFTQPLLRLHCPQAWRGKGGFRGVQGACAPAAICPTQPAQP